MSHQQAPEERGMARWIVLFFVVLAALLVGAITLPDAARGRGWLVADAASTVGPSALKTQASAGPGGSGTGVIDAAPTPSSSGNPQAAAVTAKLQAVSRATNGVTVDGTVTANVVNLNSGELLYNSGAGTPMIPASTLKILTVVAAIDAIGTTKTLTTKVVTGAGNNVVLVGGGDPLLAISPTSYRYGYPKPANLTDLAATTANVLKERGLTSITLSYDDSLFSGPNWAATWMPSYNNVVTPISALMADQGVDEGKDVHIRTMQPSQHAANIFAAKLVANGIQVSGTPASAGAAPQASVLAKVDSLPVIEIAQHALLFSDNTTTEVLLRHLGLAKGQPGSFDGGTAALTDSLQKLGLWEEGMGVFDGCGLSKSDRVTASSLTRAIRLLNTRDDLRLLYSGLPVGGATGTLEERYGNDTGAAGRGWVRAKTGTLAGVSSLAGYTRTQDGTLIVFAFIGNGTTVGDMRAYLDALTASLTSCGCG